LVRNKTQFIHGVLDKCGPVSREFSDNKIFYSSVFAALPKLRLKVFILIIRLLGKLLDLNLLLAVVELNQARDLDSIISCYGLSVIGFLIPELWEELVSHLAWPSCSFPFTKCRACS